MRAYDQDMSDKPERPGSSPSRGSRSEGQRVPSLVEDDVEKVVLERLATAGDEPTTDAREAIAEIRRMLRQPVLG